MTMKIWLSFWIKTPRILQKHIKRQIISLIGGFQIIADLNAYHTFITSLKIPSIVSDFSYLKMLGHVYVVEDAKDLAQIVRDVTRYGGAYRPEVTYIQSTLCEYWLAFSRMSMSLFSDGQTGRRLKKLWIKQCITWASKRTASFVSSQQVMHFIVRHPRENLRFLQILGPTVNIKWPLRLRTAQTLARFIRHRENLTLSSV